PCNLWFRTDGEASDHAPRRRPQMLSERVPMAGVGLVDLRLCPEGRLDRRLDRPAASRRVRPLRRPCGATSGADRVEEGGPAGRPAGGHPDPARPRRLGVWFIRARRRVRRLTPSAEPLAGLSVPCHDLLGTAVT